MWHFRQWMIIAAVGSILAAPGAGAEEFILPHPFVLTDPPATVPALILRNDHDEKIDLATWRGRYVLLSFWATWCAPCIEELPSLNSLQDDLDGKRFQVVPVSVEGRSRMAKTAAFMRAYRLGKLPVLTLEKNKDQYAFDVRAVPTTLLIDPEGREIWRILGSVDWDNREVRAVLAHYLDPPP